VGLSKEKKLFAEFLMLSSLAHPPEPELPKKVRRRFTAGYNLAFSVKAACEAQRLVHYLGGEPLSKEECKPWNCQINL